MQTLLPRHVIDFNDKYMLSTFRIEVNSKMKMCTIMGIMSSCNMHVRRFCRHINIERPDLNLHMIYLDIYHELPTVTSTSHLKMERMLCLKQLQSSISPKARLTNFRINIRTSKVLIIHICGDADLVPIFRSIIISIMNIMHNFGNPVTNMLYSESRKMIFVELQGKMNGYIPQLDACDVNGITLYAYQMSAKPRIYINGNKLSINEIAFRDEYMKVMDIAKTAFNN